MNDTPTTLQDAKKELAGYGMTVNRQPSGELRVDFRRGTEGYVRGPEGSSYHAGDLSDAVGTAREMRAVRDRSEVSATKGIDLGKMADKSAARVAERTEKPEADRATRTL